MLKTATFNHDACYHGVECLRVYRKSWDAVKQVFSNKPLHDYASDPADAFRYCSIVANAKSLPAPSPHDAIANSLIANRQFSLDKLHADRHSAMRGSSISRRRI